MDFLGLMKKAEELQKTMGDVQADLAEMVVTGSAGAGMVTVTLSGKGVMKGLKIDPVLFKEDDVSVLEDLIVAAHSEAKAKSEALAQEKMATVTAGLPLPPGLKLPF